MAVNGNNQSENAGDWNPSEYGVAFESFEPPAGRARPSRIARHGSWPFVHEIPQSDDPDLALRNIGYAYLFALDQFLRHNGRKNGIGLPNGWLNALDPKGPAAKSNVRLRWLNVWPSFGSAGGDGKVPTPPRLASWRLLHSQKNKQTKWNGTVVLTAAETLGSAMVQSDGNPFLINRDIGIRIPVSIQWHEDVVRLTIRSMTAELPFAPYYSSTELEAEFGALGDFGTLDYFIDQIGTLNTDVNELEDIRIKWKTNDAGATVDAFEIRGKGPGSQSSDGQPLSNEITDTFSSNLSAQGVRLFDKVGSKKRVLSVNASAGQAMDFRQDPSSWRDRSQLDVTQTYDWLGRRPGRTDATLNAFTELETIGPHQTVQLETQQIRVVNCPQFVHSDPQPITAPNAGAPPDPGTKTVDLPANKWPQIRRNDYTAIMAFENCNEFFRIVEGLNIDLSTLIVEAKPRIDVHYRSGIKPGPGKNGQTINARVSIVSTKQEALPAIEVHLALGNISRQDRPQNLPADERWAQPLGIADAERWIWHEFGHVLIAARLGRLELDFVHSIGDGMAAVKADPYSRLADPRGLASSSYGCGEVPMTDRMRGYTYPWVFIPRRHDRAVNMGWAWGGALNRSLLDAPEDDRRDSKGYVTEQILSTTLFRLYRVLGGDTLAGSVADGPDYLVRERASAVTLYLIIEAIRMMAQPPSRAEALEEGMEAADVAILQPLELPRNLPSMGDTSPLPVPWTGGRARKVVRWVFEAQGMFPPDPNKNHNAPGQAPQVDIFIPDMRPCIERTEHGHIDYEPGSYAPVSLDWTGERRWQADPNAFSVSNGHLSIDIGNRGRDMATGLRLRWWFGLMSGSPADPNWEDNDQVTWFELPGQTIAATIAPGSIIRCEYEPELQDASAFTHILILVEVSCPDDRANSSADGLLPTAIAVGELPPANPREIVDLVANDNNLGLWMK